MRILRDGSESGEMTLNQENGWQDSVYIATGLMLADGTVLDSGHDYTLAEPEGVKQHWELDIETVRPMLINGVQRMLVLVTDGGTGQYTIDGKQYNVKDAAGNGNAVTATNLRKSQLTLTKQVVDSTGAPFETDQLFAFSLTVTDAGGQPIRFSAWDPATQSTVTSLTVTGATADPQQPGVYSAASGSAFMVHLKAGWQLNLLDLASGSAYSISESTLPAGYTFSSASGGAVDGQTVSGTISAANQSYEVVFVNEAETTAIRVRKEWQDGNNQDGIRPASVSVQLYAGNTAVGSPVTLSQTNGWADGWDNLPAYADGQAIAYRVEETETDVITGTDGPGTYRWEVVSGEEDGEYIVRNWHTPEETEATVVKVWDDANNQDGKRPVSLTVTLSDGQTVTLNDNNNWTATITGLPKYADGQEITYTWTEGTLPEGYTLTGTATEGTVTTLTNSYTTYNQDPYSFKFTFTKQWQGAAEKSIDWVLHNPDGSTAHKKFNKKTISETEWRYEAWFPTAVDYYVEEIVPEGYTVKYENVGAHAEETDRCYNGGTIINYKIPKTGDAAPIWLWIGLVAAGLLGTLLVGRSAVKKRNRR